MSRAIDQAVILAGGLGTRLAPFTLDNPKPMYPFNGRPFIDYLVGQVRGFGIKRILLLLGWLPEKIMEHLGDGSRFGVEIEYDVTPVEYDTGLRLRHAADRIDGSFLLMYCDNYCPIRFSSLAEDFFGNGALIQLSAYANRDGYTRDNLRIADGAVLEYDKKRKSENLSGVDIGYALVSREVLSLIPEENGSFEAQVYPRIVERGRMFATVTEHRYYSVGSWERIGLAREFFTERKVVFLDRDGTLNVRAPKARYVERPEDFVWLPGAVEAVKALKDAGCTVILVSNQPGIARGNLTEETLGRIHAKMQDELRQAGAGIDRIYYCPHNWDDGCLCRKPKPGMLYQAQKDLSLNLHECTLIGDDERDIAAGEAAGCRAIRVGESFTLLDAVRRLLANQ